MKKINTEELLIVLFRYGFERIDPVLYTLVLEKVVLENAKTQEYEISFEEPLGELISDRVEKVNSIYKLKENQVSKELWFKYHSNDRLYKYIESLNFEEIISKKVNTYGPQGINNTNFSKKEIDIIIENNIKRNNQQNDIIKKLKQKNETIKEITSNNDYIEWLIEFTKKNNGLIYDDIDNIIDKDDIENINKISVFFDVIDDYVEQNKISDGYFCKIKYKGEEIHIGVRHGLTVSHFVSLPPKVDELGIPKIGYGVGITDYEEILDNYIKYNKPKEYKKTNN